MHVMQFFSLLLIFFSSGCDISFASTIAPNATVANDGSGTYTTIVDAIAAVPVGLTNTSRHYILVKAGVYQEYVYIPKDKAFITLMGDDVSATIITGSHSNATGFSTSDSATIKIEGEGFAAWSLTFENTAGPLEGQAVAVNSRSKNSAFYRCRFLGFQDTLYVGREPQLYKECDIYGSVDFIFGFGPVIFQDCMLFARLPNSQVTVTAQGRNRDEVNGFVFQNCSVTISNELKGNESEVTVYLGRPWSDYSTVIFMQSFLDSVVVPSGWLAWAPGRPLDELYCAEYSNSGLGARTSARVNWTGYHLIDTIKASEFTISKFIGGDNWIRALNIPYYGGLFT